MDDKDYDPIPLAHEADQPRGTGDYMDSGMGIFIRRDENGRSRFLVSAYAFCQCCHQLEFDAGRYRGKVLLPEGDQLLVVCPLMV
jgi:hypothetical protein